MSEIKKHNPYNSIVVNELSKKYGLTERYIRMCLKGDRNGLTADTIRSDYKKMVLEIEAFIKSNNQNK